MATSLEFIEYVCEQISGKREIRYRKMFGEYMIYINEKPILLVCDNTVFVKMLDEIKKELDTTLVGYPYKGAKQHYILDIDNREQSLKVIDILEPITPLPKPRKKKKQDSPPK